LKLKKLIKKCKRNDRKAQSQIYQLYATKLFFLCLKYSKNKQEAEDNLQNGFITIFSKIKQFKFSGSFEGWMKRIIVNTALQTYRTQKVLSLVNENFIEDVTVEVDEDEISLDYLLSLIQGLPNRYRMVFNMYILDGYSHKEIAALLKISEGTSKSNLSRARAILKNKIEKDFTYRNSYLVNS